MSMAQEIDYTTLKWVKTEIDESLNQTRLALEAYVENPSDSTQIRFCATYLHQVYGTLQMVEIYGGALLAEEMEHLAHAIAQEKINNKDEAYDALMRAILQLPSYLEHLEQGQQDMPVILLPLLNDLRASRGEHLLSENAFFSPDLKVAPPAPKEDEHKQVEIKEYAKKLRSVYQSALVGLYRSQDIKGNLKKIGAVLRELTNSSTSNNASRLWWVSSGLVEALLQGGLEINNPIKQLIGQIDPYIKSLITKGEQIFEDKPPEELLKNLLYYVAMSKSDGKRVNQIKTAFNLEQILPTGNDISEAFGKLRGSNNELMRSVSAVIKEDLLQIKDKLDVFVRSSDRNAAELAPFADQLSRISDTLAMLGLGDLHKIIQDQIATIRQIIDSGNSPTEINLMEIASSLLYIESSLEGVESAAFIKRRQDIHDTGGATFLPDNETLQLNNLVITEASQVMTTIKDSFNTYANDPTDPEIIKDTPALLNQVRGVLSVLQMDRAAKILLSTINYIGIELLDNRIQPNQPALDALADVITSIEYYLESVAEGRHLPENILQKAEESANKLGIDVNAEITTGFTINTDEEPQTSSAVEVDNRKPVSKSETTPLEPAAEPTDSSAESVDVAIAQTAAEPVAASTTQAQPEQEIDEEILEIFLEEADEVFAEMQTNLQAWKDNHDNDEALTSLRRSYHTLKGSGRLAGALVLGEFAWAMENMLNQVIKGKIYPAPPVFQLLSNAENALTDLLNQLKNRSLPIPNVQAFVDAADALGNGETPTVIPSISEAAAAVTAEAEALSNTSQPIEVEDVETPLAELTMGTNEADESVIEFSLEPVLDEDNAEELITLETIEEAEPEIVMESAEVVELPSQDSMLSEIFRKETATHLASIQHYLDDYPHHSKHVVTEPLLRALHTLHGSARMANVAHIAEISELLHRFFRTLHDSNITVEHDSLDALTQGMQMINTLIDMPENAALPDNFQSLCEHIKSVHETVQHQVQEQREHRAEDNLLSIGEDEDAELINIFLEEATDILASLSTSLQSWRDDLANPEYVEELQRSLHTLKGGARMANINAIADTSHQLESLIEHLIEKQVLATPDIHHLVQECHDWLSTAIEDVRNHAPIEVAQELLEKIARTHGDIDAMSSATADFESHTQEQTTFASDALEEITLEDVSPESFTLEDNIPVEISLEGTSSEDEELLNIFFEEAQEIQESIEHTLQQWQDEIDNLDHIAELQRSLHTLKGGARMANIAAIADLSHTIETVLENISVNNTAVSPELPHLIHQCHDWIAGAIDALKHHQTPQAASDLIERLEQAASSTPVSDTIAAEPEATIEDSAPAPALTQVIEIPGFAEDRRIEASADYDEDLVSIFLEEAEEIQDTTDKILQQWLTDYANKGLIAEMQRALHTLKGGARMANLSPIGDLSHAIESLLESVTEGKIEAKESFPRMVQLGHDWLAQSIDNVKRNRSIDNASYLIEQLEALAAGKDVAISANEEIAEPQVTAELIELPTGNREEIVSEFAPRLETRARTRDEQIRVRAELLDILVNSASEANIYNSRIGQQLGSWKFNLAELSQTVVRLQEQLRKFEIETEAQIMYRHAVNEETAVNDDFDPLELDRFSYMQQLSRGMVESLGDLTSIQDLLESVSEEADVLLLQQSRINGDLQEGLMRTRLTPFSSILPRLRRIVRQTCTETDKEAQLVVEGAEGEMDRTQLNRVVPALEHILRNAVDHGIEKPDDREKAGKQSFGTINLNFSREGSEVVLHISDDGKGINTDAIRKKAIERGLLKENANISDNEVTEFILQSGFSTAEQVTQISGRGVGMDVVNTEIKQLNGSLHIENKPGQGTHFTIRLPLTVLTNQALMILVDERTYAIQLSNIEHVIRVTGSELGQLASGEMAGYEYAGHHYEGLNIGRLLHNSAPLAMNDSTKYPLLLCRSGDHRVAVHVDQLIGRQEIVVKSVGPQLSTVNNISGATILPNGEVALILDLNTLIRSNLAFKQRGEDEQLLQPRTAPELQQKPVNVMIVDDSITVRKVTERLLKRHNFETLTAKDGVDALTQLLEVLPDIMLLDVEMPRMDGYELATAIRNDERLKHLPIIMITSRTGEKHVERAMNIGVNMVMGKPYHETDLLENIDTLLNRHSN